MISAGLSLIPRQSSMPSCCPPMWGVIPLFPVEESLTTFSWCYCFRRFRYFLPKSSLSATRILSVSHGDYPAGEAGVVPVPESMSFLPSHSWQSPAAPSHGSTDPHQVQVRMPSMQLIQLLVATEGQQAHGQELLLSMRRMLQWGCLQWAWDMKVDKIFGGFK